MEAGASGQCVPGLEPWNEGSGERRICGRFWLCLEIVHGLRDETGLLHRHDVRRFSAVECFNSQRSGPPLMEPAHVPRSPNALPLRADEAG